MSGARGLIVVALSAFGLLFFPGCGDPFTPPSEIHTRRFLAITADPLEASPGESVSFRAIVTNADGSLYDGPVVWAVASGDALRLTGDNRSLDEPVHLPASEPFIWRVPPRDELEARYGLWESRGLLLTVGATAFESADVFAGETIGKAIPAFKLFVVSETKPEARWENPELASLVVESAGGTRLSPEADGRYQTDASRVILHAISHDDPLRLSYRWFSTTEGFDPDNDNRQKLERDRKGPTAVYVVLRQTRFFDHDDGTRTRVAGIDWKRIDVDFR